MSETDRDFVSRMHDKHLRCEAMSFDDGNRVFALALSGAEAAALTAENERLNSDLTDALTDRTHDQTQIMENAEQIRLLTARVKELEGQHKGLVIQNALLRQRPDLPADRIPAARGVEALTARAAELEGVLDLYRDVVRIDATMEGPKFMGANASALKRAWDADRAAPTQPATEKGGEWNHKEEQQKMWDIAAEVSRDGE